MRKRTKRKLIIGICILALAVIFVISPLFPYVRSLLVMSVFSSYCQKDSIAETEGIELKIPGGHITEENDWYPFVMCFNADESFTRYTGDENSRLTIYYNFPQFDLKKGCSKLFDKTSPLYSGFYGAYLVKNEDGSPFGFDANGNLKTDEVASLTKFDIFQLVLGDMGLKREERVFNYRVTNLEEDFVIDGTDGWTRADIKLNVNGACHTPIEKSQSYLQYGKPNYKCSEDFAPTEMSCTVIAKYLPEKRNSIFLYVMCKDTEECQRCVDDIILNSKITSK